MKIAAVTEDGNTISQHFGRAPYYAVITIEDGQITQREIRGKLNHSHAAHHGHEEHTHLPGRPHGYDPASQDRHQQMAAVINDCEALLCRGMGMAAYESIRSAGIRPIVTDIAAIDQAVQAYLDGAIVDHTEKLH
jgi:predicted Fe-Mo cluster-binding NifX family protein